MSFISPKYFKYKVKENVLNETLMSIVKKATSLTLAKRKNLITDQNAWEDLRQEGHNIRKKAIDNLDYYLKVLKSRLNENGIKVLHANDSKEACKLIIDILKKNKAKLIVKSKSMVTEEIKLNETVIGAGFEIVETDLGEFIIQIAGETPSHVTAPAMHKSRDDIGKLFTEKLNLPLTNDPKMLTQYARNILREKFLKADVGISGANFLIAETGTIVIVENEGNARLTTTIPDIHIVITGIEKVIPDFNDAATLLKLLPASATGQKLTSYVSFINSPVKSDEFDGPREIYLILLDNGRAKLAKNNEMKEALYCIKCGACMNICPVYQTVSGHAYGSVYPGPIGSVLTPMMVSLKDAKDLAYGSTLCGACSEICPVKIDIHHGLLRIRNEWIQYSKTNIVEKLAFLLWRLLMQSTLLYNLSSKFIRFIMPLFSSDGRNIKIPGWSDYKDFPPLAKKSFHDFWKEKNGNI